MWGSTFIEKSVSDSTFSSLTQAMSKKTNNAPSWNSCHTIFLDTPPKFDEQIPKNDLETCISGFKYVLCIYFGGSQSFEISWGFQLPLWIRDSILSFGMDGCSNFESPNYLDPNHPASYRSLVAILTIFMEANQTPYSQPRYPSGSSLRITGDPKITLTPQFNRRKTPRRCRECWTLAVQQMQMP